MNLIALPAFTDNYFWMLHDGREALVVDPGDSAPVVDALDRLRLALTGILVTHHHADHVDGVSALMTRLNGPVHGPRHETLPVAVQPHGQGDLVEWNGIAFQVFDVPGHTSGHVAYFAEAAPGGPLLFCGDTLFSGGCGRLFEGTPEQMHASLTALSALPASTRVCCAHEYTLSNLRFALAAEPANAELQVYLAQCEAKRRQELPTLPSTIGVERQINPFLRCDQPALADAAREHGATSNDPVSVFAALRQWKNVFR
jgi:hydroxyacylglutathione hydrolase